MSKRKNSKVAVIGQGIIGLTTALRLVQSNFEVDIVTRDDFWQTTSASAGAYWWPHKIYPKQRVKKWSRETYQEYFKLKDILGSGVSFKDHLRFCVDQDESSYVLEILDNWRKVKGSDYGFDCAETYQVSLPIIEVPIYLPYLKLQLNQAGVKFIYQDLNSLNDLFSDYNLIVNCSGIGAKKLAQDNTVYPIRGQTVQINKPTSFNHSTRVYELIDQMTLILPRSKDCILGGTTQENDWSLKTDPNDTKEIIKRCSEIVPEIAECEILGTAVGLRPGRNQVRLETEVMDSKHKVIHNYGHSGGGFTVCWGCANEVLDLARQAATANSNGR